MPTGANPEYDYLFTDDGHNPYLRACLAILQAAHEVTAEGFLVDNLVTKFSDAMEDVKSRYGLCV